MATQDLQRGALPPERNAAGSSPEEAWRKVKGCRADQIPARLGQGWQRVTSQPIRCGAKLLLHKYKKDNILLGVAFKEDGLPAFVVFDDKAVGHNVEEGSRHTEIFRPPPIAE